MDFQQSKTYTNVQNAYSRELMVSTLYEIFGGKAREEGYIQIANIYDVISRNEKEHARIFLKQLNNGQVPATQDNLMTSSNLEIEASEEYRNYANVAREEGYDNLASLFNGIANIELNHDLRFRSLHEDILRGEVFCKPEETLWICMECGNIMSGTCAPIICPVCGFPQGYYRVYNDTIS